MTNEFMREERYIVFKMSDLGNSLKGDEIRRLAREYAEQRHLKGKPPLECVVVESDWPEYEPTWRAIEARVTGAQQCKNCNGMGDRFDPSGEKIPCDLCESHLEEIRSLVAEAAHDIISGSDFWLSISLAAKKIYALPGAKVVEPAPSVPDVDALAQFIREIDGKHQLGAGALAERIVEWLAAAPEAKQCP